MLFKDGPWKSNNTYVKIPIFFEYYYKILWHLQKGFLSMIQSKFSENGLGINLFHLQR